MSIFQSLLAILVCIVVLGYADLSHAATASTSSSSKVSSKYQIFNPILLGVDLEDITPNFGEPRGGGTRTHEGLDIMAPEGTPIVSPVKATVLKTGKSSMPGNYVYTKGSDGHVYAYMHLKDIAKLRRGQKLQVGDLIGTVGETGNAKGTTPHLHMEIRKSKPIDPFARITKEFSFEDKIKYLNAAVSDTKNSKTFVKFVVDEFSGTLAQAESQKLELNSKLEAALRAYESDFSVADATVGLTQGAENKSVKAVQYALIRNGVGPEAVLLSKKGATGYFGPLTHRALMEYQKSQGLPSDGIFNVATKQALQIKTS